MKITRHQIQIVIFINQQYVCIKKTQNMANQELNCFQINLQHSCTATSNLVHLINQHRIDVAFIQETYTIRNQLAGIPKIFRTYTYGNDRSRAAVIISNKDIDATTITQISDKDCIAIEIKYNGKTFYGAACILTQMKTLKEIYRKWKICYITPMETAY